MRRRPSHGTRATCGRSAWKAIGNYQVKDQLETAVCKALCSGDLTLEQARSMFLEPRPGRKVFLKFYQVE